MKLCTHCRKVKESKGFYKNNRNKSGLSSWCKTCHTTYRHTEYARKLNLKAVQRYAVTSKGRVSRRNADIKRAKSEARHISWAKKQTKRRKNLGWTILFDNPINEEVEWHHISSEYVVAIPKDIHKLYTGYSLKMHRELCMNVINQIYLEEKYEQ